MPCTTSSPRERISTSLLLHLPINHDVVEYSAQGAQRRDELLVPDSSVLPEPNLPVEPPVVTVPSRAPRAQARPRGRPAVTSIPATDLHGMFSQIMGRLNTLENAAKTQLVPPSTHVPA